MPRQRAVMTYGRRHQLRQVHADDDQWGSVFDKEKKDPVFGSSFSSGNNSSTKLSDSSSDFSTSTRKAAQSNKYRARATTKNDKENADATTRKTRKKKTVSVFNISDGLSNTSSEQETSKPYKRPLLERNVNTKTTGKAPKSKKVVTKRKTRKKEKEEDPPPKTECSALFDMSRTDAKSIQYSQHFSEFEDFSLCIETDDSKDKGKKVIINAPPNLTPSASSDNNSHASSTHRSLQHSTPNVHTSTPQNSRALKDDLFRRLTKSNLKKLAASGGMSPLPNGMMHDANGSMLATVSPACSHISHRRESMDGDFEGDSMLNGTQDSGVNLLSTSSSFLVTTRRNKPRTKNGHMFNMSSILSPCTPGLRRRFAPIAEDAGTEILEVKPAGVDLDECEERLSELHISNTCESLQTNAHKNNTEDLTSPSRLDPSQAADVRDLSGDATQPYADSDYECEKKVKAAIQSDIAESGASRTAKVKSPKANNITRALEEGTTRSDTDSEFLGFHQPGIECLHCSQLNQSSNSSHRSNVMDTQEHSDNEKHSAAYSDSDTEPDDKTSHHEDQVVLGPLTPDNLPQCGVHLNKLSESLILKYTTPQPKLNANSIKTPRCTVSLKKLPDSVLSQYTNAGSSEYDASKSLFEDSSSNMLNIEKSTDYDTAEDRSPVMNMIRSNQYYASSTEGTSDGEVDEDEDFCSAAGDIPRSSLLSCIDELEELNQSLRVLTPMKSRISGRVLSPRTKVLRQCDQVQPISFNKCIPTNMMKKCIKIGEGVFGEVYRSENKNSSVALKVIPIEGDFTVNDEPQKTFLEILSEIVISGTLSDLSQEGAHSTCNFVQVHSCSVVEGSYPGALIQEWDRFHTAKVSENDRPDMFPDNQLFIVFEFADSGCDLEGFKFKNMREAKSVLVQVALSLAVAESALEFEHRDLHWGNVLVKRTTEKMLSYTLDDEEMELQSHGVQVAIIDFTLSRLRKDGCTVSCDLSQDPTLFEGQGDYQFEVYRLMKEENGNNWETFHPYTNVLWIHYLADKLLRGKVYPRLNTKESQAITRQFRTLIREATDYNSALHLINDCPFFADEIFS